MAGVEARITEDTILLEDWEQTIFLMVRGYYHVPNRIDGLRKILEPIYRSGLPNTHLLHVVKELFAKTANKNELGRIDHEIETRVFSTGRLKADGTWAQEVTTRSEIVEDFIHVYLSMISCMQINKDINNPSYGGDNPKDYVKLIDIGEVNDKYLVPRDKDAPQIKYGVADDIKTSPAFSNDKLAGEFMAIKDDVMLCEEFGKKYLFEAKKFTAIIDSYDDDYYSDEEEDPAFSVENSMVIICTNPETDKKREFIYHNEMDMEIDLGLMLETLNKFTANDYTDQMGQVKKLAK